MRLMNSTPRTCKVDNNSLKIVSTIGNKFGNDRRSNNDNNNVVVTIGSCSNISSAKNVKARTIIKQRKTSSSISASSPSSTSLMTAVVPTRRSDGNNNNNNRNNYINNNHSSSSKTYSLVLLVGVILYMIGIVTNYHINGALMGSTIIDTNDGSVPVVIDDNNNTKKILRPDNIPDKMVPYNATACDSIGIPKLLHYTWKNKDFSFIDDNNNNNENYNINNGYIIEQKKILNRIEIIKQNNPEYTIKVWTDKECMELMEEYFPSFMKTYYHQYNPRKFWDIVRIVILWVHGGIYLDHDVECQNNGISFSNWIHNDNSNSRTNNNGGLPKLLLIDVIQKESIYSLDSTKMNDNSNSNSISSRMEQRKRTKLNNFIQQGGDKRHFEWIYERSHPIRGNFFMGSVPGHPFWLLYLKLIIDDNSKDLWVLEHTGPGKLADTYTEYTRDKTQTNIGTYTEIRVLQKHEMQRAPCTKNTGGTEPCIQSQCTHLQSISPSELEEDRTEQVRSWKQQQHKHQQSNLKFTYGNGTVVSVLTDNTTTVARRANNTNQQQQQQTQQQQQPKNRSEFSLPSCNPCESPIMVYADFNNSNTETTKQLIFIHIPKNGGTSIEHVLNKKRSCHVTAMAIHECPGHNHNDYNTSMISFTVLRHPIKRAISMYRYAKQGGNGRKYDINKYSWVHNNLNFKNYVKELPKQTNLMYAPQSHFITVTTIDAAAAAATPANDTNKLNTKSTTTTDVDDDTTNVNVDQILCLESIDEDWKDFVETMGLVGMIPENSNSFNSNVNNSNRHRRHQRNWDSTAMAASKTIGRTLPRLRVSNSSNKTVVVDAETHALLQHIYSIDFLLWNKYCGPTRTHKQANTMK